MGNEKIKTFARYLSDAKIPVWIRYVLIPGYTDDTNGLQQAAGFIKTLKNVQKVEVLPYHTMGAFKWDEIGDAYLLKEVKEPTEQQLKNAKAILTSAI